MNIEKKNNLEELEVKKKLSLILITMVSIAIVTGCVENNIKAGEIRTNSKESVEGKYDVSILGHTQASGDLAVAHPLGLAPFDDAQALRRDPPPARAPARSRRQRHHAALGVAPLMASHRTLRAAESSGDLSLLREARVDEEDHRVGLGHRIANRVMVHR